MENVKKLLRTVSSFRTVNGRFAWIVLMATVSTTTSASETPSLDAKMKSKMFANNATNPSNSTTDIAKFKTARFTMTINVLPVIAATSLPVLVSANDLRLDASGTKEENALTVSPASGSREVSVSLKAVKISRT